MQIDGHHTLTYVIARYAGGGGGQKLNMWMRLQIITQYILIMVRCMTVLCLLIKCSTIETRKSLQIIRYGYHFTFFLAT